MGMFWVLAVSAVMRVWFSSAKFKQKWNCSFVIVFYTVQCYARYLLWHEPYIRNTCILPSIIPETKALSRKAYPKQVPESITPQLLFGYLIKEEKTKTFHWTEKKQKENKQWRFSFFYCTDFADSNKLEIFSQYLDLPIVGIFSSISEFKNSHL